MTISLPPCFFIWKGAGRTDRQMIPDTMPDPMLEHRLVLITGPSGAGRSTAIHVLE